MRSNALVTLALVAAATYGTSQANAQAAAQFEAGKHYTQLTPAQPTSTDAGKVEVAEVFMFGCPGCFAFEPHLTQWLATKPDYVTFVRIPALWNPVATLHARAFYTAELLGKTAEIEEPFFTEFHVNGNRLDSQPKLAAFFAKFGVDATTFNNTFASFAVDTQLKRAENLIERYGVRATPTVVVNGKYLTNGQMAGSYAAWFDIIDELVATEHAAASGRQ